MENITLIFQGPIGRRPDLLQKMLIKHAPNYPVIISGYEMDDTKFLEGCRTPFALIKSPPLKPQYLGNTLPYQIYTTLNGLKQVKTSYVIKLRTDEYYDNLGPLIYKFFENPTKLVCSNIFYISPRAGWEAFHISDHIFCATTSSLLKCFQYASDHIHQYDRNPFHLTYTHDIGLEAFILLSYLEGNRLNWERARTDLKQVGSVMKEFTDVVDINEMGPYEWCCAGNYYNDDRYLYENGYNKSIKSLEELIKY